MSLMTDGRRNECKSPGLSVKFQQMYKAISPSAPPWKEAYRKRCHERLADSRQSLLGKFRWKDDDSSCSDSQSGSARTVAIRDLVLNEWQAFKQERNHLSTDTHCNADSLSECEEIDCVGTEDIDDVLSVFDEITAELLREEEQILAEYEAKSQFDDAALCASIGRMTTNELICPVCQKNPLFVNKGVVFCSCGLRIDTEQDAITLDMVRTSLSDAIETHNATCESSPTFAVVTHPGISNLLMTCQTCDFMFIVV